MAQASAACVSSPAPLCHGHKNEAAERLLPKPWAPHQLNCSLRMTMRYWMWLMMAPKMSANWMVLDNICSPNEKNT